MYSTLETALPRIHGDWAEPTPIRGQQRLMSRFVMWCQLMGVRIARWTSIEMETLMGSDEHWQETSQHCRIVMFTDQSRISPACSNNCNFINITSCQETYSSNSNHTSVHRPYYHNPHRPTNVSPIVRHTYCKFQTQ